VYVDIDIATFNQQNTKCSSLDIYITSIIARWAFLQVSIHKRSSSGKK